MDTGRISEGPGGSPDLGSSGSDKGGIRSVFAENHIAHRGLSNHPLTAAGEGFFPLFFKGFRRGRPLPAAASKTALEIARRTAIGTAIPQALRAEHHGMHDP